jgi:hypothetical protein
MNEAAIKLQITKRLEKLPIELQKQVLDFTEALVSSTPKGVKGKHLLKFSGTISEEDANSMIQTIGKNCKK